MAKYRKTEEQIKREVAQLKEEIEVLKELARERGHAFASLDEEQLARKLRGETSKSPFLYTQSWTSGTFPGNAANYTATVRNPDPNAHYPVHATIFFGLGNVFETSEAWIGRDKRWPELSSEPTLLASNSSYNFSFSYTVPTDLPRTTYHGNLVLWARVWNDVSTAFDRGSFHVTLL